MGARPLCADFEINRIDIVTHKMEYLFSTLYMLVWTDRNCYYIIIALAHTCTKGNLLSETGGMYHSQTFLQLSSEWGRQTS